MNSKKFERVSNYCLYITSTMNLGEDIKDKAEVLKSIMIKHYRREASIEDYNKVYELERLILKSLNE